MQYFVDSWCRFVSYLILDSVNMMRWSPSHDLMANDTQFSVDAVGLQRVMRPYKAKVIFFYLFFVLRYGESSSDFNNSKIWKESRKTRRKMYKWQRWSRKNKS